MRVRFVTLLLAMFVIPVGLAAQSEPLIGTWRLNVERSTPAPRSGTIRIEAVPGGIRAVADGVNVRGQATHSEYTAMFDGKDYPWRGTIDGNPNPNQDAIAIRKIDAYTYEATNKLKGQVLTVARWVISRDGRTRTLTVAGKNAQGQTVSATYVYEKQ